MAGAPAPVGPRPGAILSARVVLRVVLIVVGRSFSRST